MGDVLALALTATAPQTILLLNVLCLSARRLLPKHAMTKLLIVWITLVVIVLFLRLMQPDSRFAPKTPPTMLAAGRMHLLVALAVPIADRMHLLVAPAVLTMGRMPPLVSHPAKAQRIVNKRSSVLVESVFLTARVSLTLTAGILQTVIPWLHVSVCLAVRMMEYVVFNVVPACALME